MRARYHISQSQRASGTPEVIPVLGGRMASYLARRQPGISLDAATSMMVILWVLVNLCRVYWLIDRYICQLVGYGPLSYVLPPLTRESESSTSPERQIRLMRPVRQGREGVALVARDECVW